MDWPSALRAPTVALVVLPSILWGGKESEIPWAIGAVLIVCGIYPGLIFSMRYSLNKHQLAGGVENMSSALRPIVIVAVLTIVSAAQHAWYWPQLPDRVATHWGIDGQANDWMTRTAATVTLCGIQIGIPLFLIAVTSLASRLPVSMVNIPNREYWLHPDRRSATLEWMSRMMGWIAVLTSLFMIGIGHLTFMANKTGSGLHVGFFLAALGGYLICVFSIAGRSLCRFRMPRPTV